MSERDVEDMPSPRRGAAFLDREQAVDATYPGGLVGYINRLREAHGPTFYDKREGGIGLGVCRCGEPTCATSSLLVHIDRLRRSYEMKVQDFAAETLRYAALEAERDRLQFALDSTAAAENRALHLLGEVQAERDRLREALERITTILHFPLYDPLSPQYIARAALSTPTQQDDPGEPKT